MSYGVTSVRFGKRQYGASPIEKIKSFPLTSVLPLKAGIKLRPAVNEGVYASVTSTDLLESLIGSLLLVPGHDGIPRQTSFLIPATSTISQLTMALQDFDLVSTPFRLTKDALMAYYVFGVSDLYEVLWRYLLVHFANEVSKIVSNGIIAEYTPKQAPSVKCIVVMPDQSENDEANDYLNSDDLARALQTLLDDYLDAKAILKAITHPHIAYWSIDYESPNQGYNRPYFVQPIDYLGFSLRIPGVLVSSIMKGINEQPQVLLRYLRMKLSVLEILGEEIFDTLSTLHNLPYAAILKGYCSMILRYFHKHIRKASRTATIRVRITDLAQALAYALIEMGIHGLSHCLMRYLAAVAKVDERVMRELVGLVYSPPSSSVLNIGYSDDRFYGIIDGYIYRFPASLELNRSGVVAAVAGAILPMPYSFSTLGKVLKLPSIQELTQFCGITDPDTCYASWLGIRAIAKAFLRGTRTSLSTHTISCRSAQQVLSISLSDVLNDIEKETEKRFKLEQAGFPEDVMRRLYLPRDKYRRILMKRMLKDVVKHKIAQFKASQSSLSGLVMECKKNVADAVRPYAPMLYEALVPHCFDGCYNCVLTRNCGTKHPMIRDWIISKSMLKILLSYAVLKQQQVRGSSSDIMGLS